MATLPTHHHPCADCGQPTECDGALEQNYDGFPAVICRVYHLVSGLTNLDFICERCELLRAERDRRAYAGGA